MECVSSACMCFFKLAASPLDAHDTQQVRPVLGRLLLQADPVT